MIIKKIPITRYWNNIWVYAF